MGVDQYHEPPGELAEEVRTFARMITSLIEEAEAIGWYAQRLSVEADAEAAAITRRRRHRPASVGRDRARRPLTRAC
jgi:hypothetical protein